MFKIAIDGPAGAGKSTISKIVAKMLHYQYIDTGAMYRAITLKALRLGIDLEDETQYKFLEETTLDVDFERIILDGVNVSEDIRSVEVTNNVSTPSKMKVVRDYLVNFQRKISHSKNVVMDGRDIGTVVLPEADLKIYLVASVETRAERRQKERNAMGIELSLAETIQEIMTRDYKDSNRELSPLKKANDAIIIDSSNLTIDEVVNRIIDLVRERNNLNMNNEKIYEGSEVTGVIINVSDNAIYLELKNGARGVIYANDISNYNESQKLRELFSEGGEFKGLVKQISKDNKTNEPLFILSTKLYSARELIKDFEALKEKDEIIKAKVVGASRVGLDLIYKDYHDIKLFLPIQAINLNEKAAYQLKGETLEVLITFVDPSRLTVKVSSIAAENRKNRQARQAAYEQLAVGMEVEGVVESLLDFGAIIAFGGLTGLLHRQEMSHDIVRDISKVVAVGETVKVKIIRLEDNKIGLSKKALIEHPWEVVKGEYEVGKIFKGKIKTIIPAGLIIELTDRFAGLMPRSEFSWLISEKLDERYHVGDLIEVKVIAIDDEKKRVTLSHKQIKENVWGEINLRRGQQIEVTIASIEDKGAVVSYKNVSGFLPISEVTNAKRISRVDEVYKVGETITATVTDCDPARARLVVSAKSEEVRKEKEQYAKYVKIQEAETPTHTIADALGDALKKYQ